MAIEYAEDLPEGCPPSDAVSLQNRFLFRFVESIPPKERDFWSQRKLFPLKRFSTDECTARACSLMTTLEACANLKKLPTHRNKRIVQIQLHTVRVGLVKKRERVHHISRGGGHDILIQFHIARRLLHSSCQPE